jgi:phthiodiolone/phenolphthiodiolone dimycocerosates ketoreductase
LVKFINWILHGPEFEKLVLQARRSEEWGFDGVCFGDRSIFPLRENPIFECWTTLTAMACNTQRISLGPCVTEPHRRHPAQTAQIAATLDQMSKGRVFVGMGAGERINLSPFGISYDDALVKLKEAAEVTKLLWSSSTKNNVDFQGKHFSLNQAFIQVQPFNETIPLYIAAHSAKTRRIAAEVGDGWISLLETPTTFSNCLRELAAYRNEIGRNNEVFNSIVVVKVAVSRSREDILTMLERTKLFLAQNQGKLKEAGFELKIPRQLNLVEMQMNEETLRLNEEVARSIPTEAAKAFSACGTPEECVATIEEYVKVGAKTIIFQNMDSSPEGYGELVSNEVLPYFWERYGRE